MTNKIELHKQIIDDLHDVYKRKSNDYGDSFGKNFEKYGIVSSLIRISDKFNRLETLSTGTEQKVDDESIVDTLLDMANYCILTVMELENGNSRNN